MINLSDLNENKYSRLELISWWDQSVLKNAKVLVVGCGALGNEIIKNLSMLGAGNIFVVDMDKVERSNLTRSVLFRTEDEGKPKAQAAAVRAMEINPDVNVKYFTVNIFNLGLGVFADMDIIICGLDNREARLFVNQSCYKVNKPWIDGAIEILSGVARMFIPSMGICYECTMTELDYKLLNKRKSCLMLGIDEIDQGKVPTTPTISSIIAGIQVQEAVKYLHGQKDLLAGKGFIYNGITNDSYIVEYTGNDECPSHYLFENIQKSGKSFDEAIVNDLYSFGKNSFADENFEIEFNNEVVFALFDEGENSESEFFANMNLLSVKDIKKDEKLLKMKSFHRVNTHSDLFEKIKSKRLIDLKIPFNDIVTLRKGNKEIHVSFNNIEIFK
ncbi:MAG: ThiF family adenylyltransferase [Bacteroidetes bacterium]|nr:ThiF family adenylyltransferase [Bacteroidota bacterium]